MEGQYEDQLRGSDMRFRILMSIFEDDLALLRTRVDIDRRQTWRRAYCIAPFTYIEALMVQLSDATLILKRSEGCGPPEGEEYTLREMRERDEKGTENPQGQASELFLEDLAYAVREYAAMNNADFQVDRATQGWASLKSALAVRDRIACPRRAADLVISDSDFERLLETHESFRETINKMLFACKEALQKVLEVFERHIERDFPEAHSNQ